ncbi:hypothetical protein L202_01103 [Cryptococcus amylolentus CBS 6039]|uniref:Uncharacterized protein n=1 Tax=Cryptococcus amylolentus CBS 6039 TaxID=1295533 RepID=A0A1E3I2R1_9TREE|nr:hypothetical protein L202_01103 [Cryptococcus amylolentus CBS 6039]ODN82839.1 hypothetical protein L202_01103 [Cryptococcus amylolentus CBS 6039]
MPVTNLLDSSLVLVQKLVEIINNATRGTYGETSCESFTSSRAASYDEQSFTSSTVLLLLRIPLFFFISEDSVARLLDSIWECVADRLIDVKIYCRSMRDTLLRCGRK